MRQVLLFTTILLFGAMISSCCTAKKAENASNAPGALVPGPKTIIYQTTKDYSKLVPVVLSDDKSSIVSYPDIKDVFFNGVLAYPTQLHKGFLLDNRGISKNVAFLRLTYEEYSKLDKTPHAAQLMEMIIDKDPVTVMYSCGNRSSYKDIEQELNRKIDEGDLSSFIRIK
jgi:hypothetical protein